MGAKVYGTLFWLGGIALFLGGCGVGAWQGFMWLRYGYWPDFDLRDLFPDASPMRFKWAGIGEIMFWFGRRSCAVAGIIAGWIFFYAGGQIFEGK